MLAPGFGFDFQDLDLRPVIPDSTTASNAISPVYAQSGVLERNSFDVEPRRIHAVRVMRAIVEGRTVFQQPR